MGASKEFLELCGALTSVDIDRVDEPLDIAHAWKRLTQNVTSGHELDCLMRLGAQAAQAVADRRGISLAQVSEDMADLHERKNAGYAGIGKDPWRNFRHSATFGVTPYMGCLVRLSDKYQRYSNLSVDPTLDKVNESIVDTLLDMACYALIAVCLRMEETRIANHRVTYFDATFDGN